MADQETVADTVDRFVRYGTPAGALIAFLVFGLGPLAELAGKLLDHPGGGLLHFWVFIGILGGGGIGLTLWAGILRTQGRKVVELTATIRELEDKNEVQATELRRLRGLIEDKAYPPTKEGPL